MRITGGQLRSRALKAPKGMATRPTSDRVREALFNILGSDCDGARVLDLYAGTGALGLEALSRGAERVVFVERGKEALAALQANVRELGASARTRVLAMPVERAARALGEDGASFDLVFADPPYADVKSGVAVVAVAAFAGLLRPHASATDAAGVGAGAAGRAATLIFEHAQRDAPPSLPGLALARTRSYGDTSLSFYALPLSAHSALPDASSEAP